MIQGGFGPNEFSLEGIPTDADRYDAPTITVRDAASGKQRDVRVIGVIGFGASNNFMGIFMGEKGFDAVFGAPELSMHFVALTDPGSSREAARDIEAALVTTGVQADSLQQIADENNALSRNFLYLMQAFMGLGLVVGDRRHRRDRVPHRRGATPADRHAPGDRLQEEDGVAELLAGVVVCHACSAWLREPGWGSGWPTSW